jgi:uncharacterized linocin/CFP29 family protein
VVDYLQRDQAPLTADEWPILDRAVVRTAQSSLVGRRFISLAGPFGAGVQVVPHDILGDPGRAPIDLLGNDDMAAIGVTERVFLPLPLIYQDFWVHWRDLAGSRQLGLPLDMGKAAAAAATAAAAEDRLIFDGHQAPELPGLRTARGRHTLPMSDWGSMGRAFADVVEGVRVLTAAGFTGPYALVVSPRLYAELNRIFNNTGVLELEQVEKLARSGVYAAAALPEPSALLVDNGADNLDLAIGLDLSTAYVESTNLNHHFRVVESLVLRIRRPGAICTFEPPSSALRAGQGASGAAVGRGRRAAG